MGEYSTKLIKPISQCNTDCKSKSLASNCDNRNSAVSIYNLCNAIDSSLRMNEQRNTIQRFPGGITVQLGKEKEIKGRKDRFIWTVTAQAHFNPKADKPKNTVFNEQEIRQKITDGDYLINMEKAPNIENAPQGYLIINGVKGIFYYDAKRVYVANPQSGRMNAAFLIQKTAEHEYTVIHYEEKESKVIEPSSAASLQPQVTALPQGMPPPFQQVEGFNSQVLQQGVYPMLYVPPMMLGSPMPYVPPMMLGSPMPYVPPMMLGSPMPYVPPMILGSPMPYVPPMMPGSPMPCVPPMMPGSPMPYVPPMMSGSPMSCVPPMMPGFPMLCVSPVMMRYDQVPQQESTQQMPSEK